MKRFLIFFLSHLVIFLILIAHEVRAEDDEWNINDFGNFIVAAVPGEVVHGDKLRFFIKKQDCSRVGMLFSFSTTRKKNEIKEFVNKKLPIRINDWDTVRGARVVAVHPMEFMTIVMMQTAGFYEIKEFIGSLMKMYVFEKEFSIQLVKHKDYDPEQYFDIMHNSWKLDYLQDKIEIAQKMCIDSGRVEKI